MIDEVAVVVPVLGRPQNAAPFVESLRASEADSARLYVVADEDDTDTITAWLATGTRVIVRAGSRGTFAEKVNLGFARTDEPWLFLVGDDVVFHPGWLQAARSVERTSKAKVIGTNDLANPRVQSGTHAVHFFVERRYVLDRGASFDGPGVLAPECYRHCYVDDEIVLVARLHDLWSPCLTAVVEHRHPVWGTAPDDATYELGRRRKRLDEMTWDARLAAHGLERRPAR